MFCILYITKKVPIQMNWDLFVLLVLHTAYISAIYQHKLCIYHYFNAQKVEQRLSNRFKLKRILKRSLLYFSDRIVESEEIDKFQNISPTISPWRRN